MFRVFCSIALQKNDIFDLIIKIIFKKHFWIFSKRHTIDSFANHKRN